MSAVTLSEKVLHRLVAGVVDPEIPVLSIADLGVLRGVVLADDGTVTVTITPTYSGCPAMDAIRDDIESVLHAAGVEEVTVETVFAPAWTTDWMTPEGKRNLAAFGIAPPGSTSRVATAVRCPRCSGSDTDQISEFGSTACKALMVCASCGEPFDRFKEH